MNILYLLPIATARNVFVNVEFCVQEMDILTLQQS